MTDMTIAEATSVLSGVANNLRAARRLEEALTVVKILEQSEKESRDKKTALDTEVRDLTDKLEVLNQETESARVKRDYQAAEIEAEMKKLASDLRATKVSLDEKVSAAEGQIAERTAASQASFTANQSELNEQLQFKSNELEAVEAKLAQTKAEVSSLRDRLSN